MTGVHFLKVFLFEGFPYFISAHPYTYICIFTGIYEHCETLNNLNKILLLLYLITMYFNAIMPFMSHNHWNFHLEILVGLEITGCETEHYWH